MSEEEFREEVEEIINNEETIKEAVIETIIEEEEVKPKPKPKAKSRAKPKIRITKEPVVEEPIIEEPLVEEPEQPKNIDQLNKIVQCPDCGLSMTQHTLLYIHTRRGFCEAIKAEPKKNTRN